MGGPIVSRRLQDCYTPGGSREFDYKFMGHSVYERNFEIIPCAPEDVPAERESTQPLGRHLDGCRIGSIWGRRPEGFGGGRWRGDLFGGGGVGASKQTDPAYHYDEIMAALKTAASKNAARGRDWRQLGGGCISTTAR